ncbi:lipid A core - O-antigen ligase [Longilinea arvoryzae]|uniref:Lipid A core-O-antigen ligase n=1 Tax=Longilinea arvoryzae TaxID=360412 RepID=A0A0S7BHZ7_9CHLR|nr:O-antigen ligase family protein [Longilinea arvoryzae]GAP13483.1 lipid A core - O-antigen ligase [Longilinea arvoryzae]
MKRIRLAPFDLSLAVFGASAWLGLAVVYDRGLGQRTWIALLGMLILYGLVSRVAVSDRHWDEFSVLLAGLGALAAFYFITQAGHIAYDEKIGAIDRVVKWVSSILPAFPIWKPVPNSLATFLESILFLTAGLALLQERPGRRILGWAAVGLLSVAILFSASRGAWLGVLGAALLWAAVHWKPARWLALLAGLGALGMVLFVLIRGDIHALAEIPVAGNLAGALFIRPDRLQVYSHSLALLAEQPFSGIGLGNAFSRVYSSYELLLDVPFLGYSHNLLLEVGLQQGLLGAAAFVWLVAALYTSLLRYPAFKSDLRFQAACAGLTATLLHGLSDARQYPSLWTWLPFFYLLGLCAARLLHARPLSRPRLGWLLPGIATAVLVGGVLANSWPPAAAWNANQAALLQTRADLDETLTPDLRSAMRSESEGLFQRALRQDPGSTPINRRYGLLLLAESRFSEAIPHLEIAWRAAPNHIGGRKGLGLAYLWSGDLDRAQAVLGGMPEIIEELQGLAWREYNDLYHYQTALYAYRLLDRLVPDQSDTREMIRILQNKLGEP